MSYELIIEQAASDAIGEILDWTLDQIGPVAHERAKEAFREGFQKIVNHPSRHPKLFLKGERLPYRVAKIYHHKVTYEVDESGGVVRVLAIRHEKRGEAYLPPTRP